VKYRLVFKDSYTPEPGKTEEFENTASVEIKLDDNDLTYKAEAVVEYGRPIVDKTMTADEGSIVRVRIVINPDGKTLAVAPGGTLTVVDEMSPELSFVDLKAIYVTIDGERNACEDLIYDNINNSITMELPDKKKIVIEYEARVAGKPGDTVTISNAVSVYGQDTYGDEAGFEFEVAESSATVGGTRATFYLLKTDDVIGENAVHLPGAVFALYNKGDYAGFDTAVLPPGLTETDKIVGADGKANAIGEYYYLMSGETDQQGVIEFNNQYIRPGVEYLLVEVKAPAGYMKLEGPILIWVYDEDEQTPSNATEVYDGIELTVTNSSGARLPETGGLGALPYTAVGAAVMVFAVAAAPVRRLTAHRRRAGRRRRRLFNDSA
jgi:uncharacterized surface anchored protein